MPLRALCRDHGVTLVGRVRGVSDDGRRLLLDAAGLHENMERIEAHVPAFQRMVQHYVEQNAHDEALQGLAPMEPQSSVAAQGTKKQGGGSSFFNPIQKTQNNTPNTCKQTKR